MQLPSRYRITWAILELKQGYQRERLSDRCFLLGPGSDAKRLQSLAVLHSVPAKIHIVPENDVLIRGGVMAPVSELVELLAKALHVASSSEDHHPLFRTTGGSIPSVFQPTVLAQHKWLHARLGTFISDYQSLSPMSHSFIVWPTRLLAYPRYGMEKRLQKTLRPSTPAFHHGSWWYTNVFQLYVSLSTQTDQLPQPVATTTDGGDSGGMAQRGANYFFGFLITFVVLLLIFVGCGIGTRRRFMTRRQAMLFGGLEQWGSLGPDVAKERPKFYEHPVGEPTEEDQWRYTMPLSVTLLRQSKDTHSIDETQNLPETNDTEAAPDQPDRTIGNILQPPYARGIPSWIPMFHEHKRLSQHEPSEIEYGPPEALHIAVMIAMPSPRIYPLL
ncbi:hypothetical protein BDZ97DRAFT_1759170 [Flammula alnicola]|nr:hypothetical protein BDZ97DRAFT_1759170 [Flammula alnicola]